LLRATSLILLLLLTGPASAVPGEWCQLGGIGDWGPIDTYTGTVSGCVDLGSDDRFILKAGAVVRTVDDLIMTGTSITRILVDGTWIVDSADRNGGPGPIRIAAAGSHTTGVQTGESASVTILGRVLEWGVDHGAGARYLETPSTAAGTYPGVDHLVLCPDASGLEDCSDPSTRHLVRLFPTAHPFLSDYLAQLTTGHRLCFFTPNDRYLSPPAQAGFCFEIVGVGPDSIDLDVRRSDGADEITYPDVLRSHAMGQLSAPVAAGDRCFLVDDVIGAEGQRIGQWVQFQASGGGADPDALLISAADDEVLPGIDRLCVADSAGVPGPRSAGEPVWLGWGIEPGDPFYIDAPIIFESATAADCDSAVRFGGSVSLRGASFRGLVSVAVGNGIPATLLDCERLWVYGKRSPRGAQILWEDVDEVSCRWVSSTTAGDELPVCSQGGSPVEPDVHGFECRSCRDFHLDDVGAAFGVDDVIYASENAPGLAADLVTGSRWNLGPSGAPGTGPTSGQMFEGSGPDVSVSDVSCTRCTSCDGLGSLVIGSHTPRAEHWRFQKVAVVGTCGGLGAPAGTKLDYADVTAIDLRPITGSLLPNRVTGGVFRGATASSTVPLAMDGLHREDLIVRDNDLAAAALWRLAPGETIRNVLVVDNECSDRSGAGGCSVLGDLATEPGSNAVLQDLTFAQTPGSVLLGPAHLLSMRGLALDVQVGGLLFLGLDGPDAVAASDFEDAATMSDPARYDWGDPICHWDNLPLGPAADNQAAYDSQAVPGVFADPELVDPGAGRFDPFPNGLADATPCGIQGGSNGPGVRQPSWALALLDLEPEFLGEGGACANGLDDDSDGWVDLADPGCQDEEDTSELSSALVCDNGMDDDGDGRADFDPLTSANPGNATTLPAGSGDPGCLHPGSPREDPGCQDGVDNDQDGGVDYDAGLSANGTADPGGADPRCAGQPWAGESSKRCGLGFELALLLPALLRLRPRRRTD
jgi:hypothetical protein